MKEYLHKVMLILGDDKKKILFIISLFLLVSFFELLGIGLIGPYINMIIDPDNQTPGVLIEGFEAIGLSEPSNREMIVFSGVIIVSVFILKVLSVILVNMKITSFSYKNELKLRAFMMSNYQSMNYRDYIERNSSEYIHGIQVRCSEFSHNVLLMGLRTISEVFVGVSILIFLSLTNPQALLLLLIILLGFFFLYDFFFKRRLLDYGEKQIDANQKMIKWISESITGFKEIRILGVNDFFLNRVTSEARDVGRYHRSMKLISFAPRYILELVLIIFVIGLILVHVSSGNEPSKIIPTLSVFGVAAIRLLPMSTSLTQAVSQLRYANNTIDRLYSDIQDCTNSVNNETNFQNSEKIGEFENLIIEDLSFGYIDEEYILKGIDLKINKGDSIGIIGPSGCGKTTLVDLIIGLLSPDKGRVIVNEIDICTHKSEWQKKIAYLPQNIFLTDDTILSNIALGVEDELIDINKVYQSIDQARLTELVRSMPDGIETNVGDKGVKLSGGQRQRIALARAFYHQRDLLILDEATSAVDNEVEKEIVDEINNLKGVKTVIVIAHRLSTIMNCDHVIKLENGKIVESGDPSKILGTIS